MSTLPRPSDNQESGVRLPPDLTHSHREVIQRYLRSKERMAGNDWNLLIQAMDLLRQAQVIDDDGAKSFAAIYDKAVDAVYSDRVIEDLLSLVDPEREYEAIRAATSRQILADLRASGLWRSDAPFTQFLVAFCLYWWQMFVRGYAFEVAIQRDLVESRIAHVAHDLHRRQERLAGHDLEVMGFYGDVKTSTYFVLARRWHRIVWLKPAFWKLLDGEPTPTAYDAIWGTLPRVAVITLRSRAFIVVFYDDWKRRVIARQAMEITND